MRGAGGHILYLAVMIWLAVLAASAEYRDLTGALVVVGVIGAWRYGWVVTNFVRAAIYRKIAYPRLRAEAERRYRTRPVAAHAWFLVTSYKIDPEVTLRVYRALFVAAARAGGGATVVVSIVDPADRALIRGVYRSSPAPAAGVALHIDRIPGTGKRDALARSFRLIARQSPTARDIVVLVDGDTCVPEDIVARTAPFFTDPQVGAVTTDEVAETPHPGAFRDWFNLRFAQRNVMMSSQGLAGRVLTLTGRMSIFRADLVVRPDFIWQVQADSIAHWRLGRVTFLTGDDKSTWFWLLSHGFLMRYLPDVQAWSMESQPRPGFADSAITLMTRWFGNMLRANGRAVALGPRRIGVFTWWALLDQKVGIWTTIAGPISVLVAAVALSPAVIPAYIAWVMLTRYLYCWLLSLTRKTPGFPISFALLLYFSQITGALVKSFVLFRLDRQKWTRQPGGAGKARQALTVQARLRSWSSVWVHTLAFGWLTFAVILASHRG